jgi:hypothetical protein
VTTTHAQSPTVPGTKNIEYDGNRRTHPYDVGIHIQIRRCIFYNFSIEYHVSTGAPFKIKVRVAQEKMSEVMLQEKNENVTPSSLRENSSPKSFVVSLTPQKSLSL